MYRYALDMMTIDGAVLGQAPVEPDWGPVLEWGSFQGMRRGRLQARMGSHPGVVEPIWDGERGEPYVSGFRAVFAGETGEAGGYVSSDVSTAYFRPLAHEASAALVEKGLLKGGDQFRFRVCAFEAPPAPSPVESADDLVVQEIVRPLPLGNTPLRSLLGNGSVGTGSNGVADDVPVIIARQVVEETMDLCRQAPEVEIGGVLLGQLHRDPETGVIFVEVTAQISAQHALSDVAKLTFTAETWANVDNAIKLRRRGEIKLGWWHQHPDWCRNCPPEKRKDCNGTSAFFSAQDIALQRACFSSAYHIAALICNGAASDLVWYLFGWRQGLVVARGFDVAGGAPAGTATATATIDAVGGGIRAVERQRVSGEGQELEAGQERDEVVRSKPMSEPKSAV